MQNWQWNWACYWYLKNLCNNISLEHTILVQLTLDLGTDGALQGFQVDPSLFQFDAPHLCESLLTAQLHDPKDFKVNNDLMSIVLLIIWIRLLYNKNCTFSRSSLTSLVSLWCVLIVSAFELAKCDALSIKSGRKVPKIESSNFQKLIWYTSNVYKIYKLNQQNNNLYERC